MNPDDKSKGNAEGDFTATNAQPPEILTGLHKGEAKKSAGGTPAVLSSFKHVFGQAGVVKGTRLLAHLNQKKGFDCPSCAWPDPDEERSVVEFCENGAKAIASEGAKKRITAAFFEKYSVAELSRQSDYWFEQQGRLTEPMVLRRGLEHYEPISWDEAFTLVAGELNGLDSPDEAIFYTSGRTSNEAAFLYQLFVRQFGANNLPDCSNMCHESSGTALKSTIGVGKGTVTLEDIHNAQFILVAGQNPGTNHPRMLTALQKAVRNGARILALNPLAEAGLAAFAHPQEARGLLGLSTPLAKRFLQVKINGDLAFFKGVCRAILELEEKNPGAVLDHEFIAEHTFGFEEFKTAALRLGWAEIIEGSGLTREEIDLAARMFVENERIITCWAMGLTQHKNAVAIIREIVNLHLLRGAIGKPGAGLCPVRGHSNVQGDRTMGICEEMPDSFFDALGREFSFQPPRRRGFNTVESIRAMREGRAKVFFAMGGNFLSASPDTEYTAQALRNCSLTVQVSTKLNRSHLITGQQALILPCLGRSELDIQSTGQQFVTVENSMGIVHQSRGQMTPASGHLLSEPMIVTRLARAVLGDQSKVDWEKLGADYGLIRDAIERVIPGFEHYNRRMIENGSFYLPNGAKERKFATPEGKAVFTVSPLETLKIEPGQLLLTTIRSHDQFNTTIYGLDDRYRGIRSERRVIYLNKEDMRERGLAPEQPVDITSYFEGEQRVGRLFLAVPYDIPKGCAAAYFPEANVLVPVGSTAAESHTPASKSIVISVEPTNKNKN